MSADLLRRAATVLRERAEDATPGEWISFGRSIGVTVKGCTCAGPIPGYPQHESWCGTDGPIVDGTEPDIAYIATMHPGVGLVLAKWLDDLAAGWPWDEDGEGCVWDDGTPLHLDESVDSYGVTIARLIVGGAS